MSTQDLFDYAQDQYRRASSIVAEMTETVTQSQPNFDVAKTKFQFDILVQLILLKIALADESLTEIEGEFIDQITDNYDIMSLYDNSADTEYNWSFVGAWMGFDHARQLINRVDKLATEHLREFIQIFAAIDKRSNGKNYLQQLFDCIKCVVVAFIKCDARTLEVEVESAVQIVREYLIEPWLAVMNKTNA